LREAKARGYLTKLPHYNSVFRYLESEALTPYLYELITASSLPLKSIESDFAVDSSGFSTGQFMRWLDVKYGKKEDRRMWLKLHLMCGTRTNIVTSVEVSDGYANERSQFPLLLECARHRVCQHRVIRNLFELLYPQNYPTLLPHPLTFQSQ